MIIRWNKETFTRFSILISLVCGITGFALGVASFIKVNQINNSSPPGNNDQNDTTQTLPPSQQPQVTTNSNNQQINYLQTQINQLQTQINNLQTQMNTMDQKYQQQLTDKQTQIDKQQTQITSLSNKIDQIQSQPNSPAYIQQQISTFQSNLTQLQSSLASIKQSIPTTKLYDIVYQNTWWDEFYAPQPTAIICDDLMQYLTITTQSIVTLTLNGHISYNSNLLCISFAVDGVPIARDYSDLLQFAYHYNWPGEGYLPITLTQKVILNPSNQAYKIQLFAKTYSSSGKIISLNGAGIQVEVQTTPPQIQ